MNALKPNAGCNRRRRKCFGGTLGLLIAVMGLLAGSTLFCYGMFGQPDAAGIARPISTPEAAEPTWTAIPIENIRLGQRVAGRNPEVSDQARAAIEPVDPATWRSVSLRLAKPDGSELHAHLLRPSEWFDAENAAIGRQVYLNIPEMGAVGWATVTAVGPCPTIDDGPGSVVTGRYIHTSGDVLDLQLAGEPAPIGTTSPHTFWSLDRQAFIPAGELTIGERLKTGRGETHVVSITPRGTSETVYNLQVHGESVFHVGQVAALVHNYPSSNAPKKQHFSGTDKPWTKGATPNSTYTHIGKDGKAIQNAIYDANGDVVGHVDFKSHGVGAVSGHGHTFPMPGNPASGHGRGKPHIPNNLLPQGWDELPSGVDPRTDIGT